MLIMARAWSSFSFPTASSNSFEDPGPQLHCKTPLRPPHQLLPRTARAQVSTPSLLGFKEGSSCPKDHTNRRILQNIVFVISLSWASEPECRSPMLMCFLGPYFLLIYHCCCYRGCWKAVLETYTGLTLEGVQVQEPTMVFNSNRGDTAST